MSFARAARGTGAGAAERRPPRPRAPSRGRQPRKLPSSGALASPPAAPGAAFFAALGLRHHLRPAKPQPGLAPYVARVFAALDESEAAAAKGGQAQAGAQGG